ncbi:MAG: hypothetical protein D6798_03140 [Deltaproteobacteria bacterium]|nr:MAG: hypothetical protein D6798_03140 [Deltaproteobacteria bacterium]
MLLPAFLHGLTSDVQAETRRRIRAFGKGASWSEAFRDELVEAASLPGLFVLHGPAPLLGGKPHNHVYLPLLEAWRATGRKGRLDSSLRPSIYAAALESAWGTLSALAPANLPWVVAPERQRPLVEAAVRYWHDLDSLGPRFSVGLPTGQSLWQCTPAVAYALSQLGLPKDQLRHLPPGGLPELVRALA